MIRDLSSKGMVEFNKTAREYKRDIIYHFSTSKEDEQYIKTRFQHLVDIYNHNIKIAKAKKGEQQ